MALKSSGTRAQKRNTTTIVNDFQSRGHTGSLRGRRLFEVEKYFEKIGCDIFKERGKTFTRF